MRLLISLIFLVPALNAYSAEFPANSWPQWRGPERTGRFDGPEWPNRLENHINERWRVPLGPGYSGPIVSTNRVFTFETEGKANEVVRALDRTTGKEQWRLSWGGAMKVPFFAAKNGSWVRSTPAYDGEFLYVGGMRDVIVCIKAETGREVWRVDFKERFDAKLPAFGLVCSPLVDGENVYVQAGASFAKLNKRTGATIWRTLEDGGGMYGSAFSSPFMATIDDVRQVLVQSRTHLAGVNPESGKVLWSEKIEAFRGMNILTPTVANHVVFTSSYGGQSWGIEITSTEQGMRAGRKWSSALQGYMCSPVLIDGHLYFHLRNQRFACVNATTGDTAYVSGNSFSKYMSLIFQGDRILGLDDRGVLHLVRANPGKFDLLESYRIGKKKNTWAHLAMAGRELYVREIDSIACFTWSPE